MTAKGSAQQASGDDQVEKLVAVLCDRLVEVLPPSQFQITVEHRHALRICSIGSREGNIVWLSPRALWQSPAPIEYRLQIFLEGLSRRVQRFVSQRNRRWPTMTAKPKVVIDEDKILIWWGGASEAEAVVALRPILRSEIGI